MTWVWDAVFPQLFEEFYCVERDLNSRILIVIYVRSVECNSPRSKWLRAQTLSQAAILKLNYHLDGRKKRKCPYRLYTTYLNAERGLCTSTIFSKHFKEKTTPEILEPP